MADPRTNAPGASFGPEMVESSKRAAEFLKAIGHEGRLLILCALADGEKSVAELEALLDARQPAVSQQLARLRLEGLVDNRRDGKTILYSLSDPKARRMVEVLYEMFCAPDADAAPPTDAA